MKPCYILNTRIAQISLRIEAENYIVKNVGEASLCGPLEIKSRRLGVYKQNVELLPGDEVEIVGQKIVSDVVEEFSSRVLTSDVSNCESDEAWAYLEVCPGITIYAGSTGFQERESWSYHPFYASGNLEDRFYLRNDPTSKSDATNVKIEVFGKNFYVDPVLTSNWDVEETADSWIFRKDVFKRGDLFTVTITFTGYNPDIYSAEFLPRWTFLSSDVDILNERTQFSLVPDQGIVY